jgi:hypothetical protein
MNVMILLGAGMVMLVFLLLVLNAWIIVMFVLLLVFVINVLKDMF